MPENISRPHSVPGAVTNGYVAFMSSVFLLAVPCTGYENITSFKYSLFLGSFGLYAVLLLIFVIRDRMRGICSSASSADISALCLLVFLFLSAISAVLSEYNGTFLGNARREGLLTVAVYVLSCLMVSHFAQPGRWMLYLFGASVTLFSVISLMQFKGMNPLGLFPAGITYLDAGILYSGEYYGTCGNAGLSTAVLCLSSGIFAMAIIKLSGKLKFLLFIPLVLSAAVIAASGINAGILALFLGCLFSLPFAAGKGHSKLRCILFIAIPFIIIFALVLLFFLPFDEARGMLYEASCILRGETRDTFGSGRIYIWRNCLRLIREKPFFGGGPDTLGQRGIEPFLRWDPERGMIRRSIDAAHNEYLNIFVNQGFFALAAYLSALLFSAVRWYRNTQSTTCAIAGAGVLFYCIQAFFGISSCISSPFMWLTLGLLIRSFRK